MYGKRLIVSLIDQYAADEPEKLYASIPTNEGTSPKGSKTSRMPNQQTRSIMPLGGWILLLAKVMGVSSLLRTLDPRI